MTLVSPWTGYLVHTAFFIREVMLALGFISCGLLVFTFLYYVCEKPDKKVIKQYAAGMLFVIAAAIAARLVIPPTEVVARIAIVYQLPEDADAEVVDELVRLVCKESAKW